MKQEREPLGEAGHLETINLKSTKVPAPDVGREIETPKKVPYIVEELRRVRSIREELWDYLNPKKGNRVFTHPDDFAWAARAYADLLTVEMNLFGWLKGTETAGSYPGPIRSMKYWTDPEAFLKDREDKLQSTSDR